MAKRISDSESIRVFGPYRDKRNPSKWTVWIYPPGDAERIIVPTTDFDLEPVFTELRQLLFRRLVERASTSKEE